MEQRSRQVKAAIFSLNSVPAAQRIRAELLRHGCGLRSLTLQESKPRSLIEPTAKLRFIELDVMDYTSKRNSGAMPHGGRIEYESEHGNGRTFTVALALNYENTI
jgi:hypothetical protein